MSYVLEALKRADAQRERGQVPGLNAQPADLPPPDDNAPAARHAPGLLLAAAGTLILVLLGGWWWSRSAPVPVVVTASSAPAPAQAVTPPTPVEAVVPAVEPLRVTPKPPPAPPPAPAVAAAPRAEPGASSPGRITPLRELPEATRRELPQLVIGGSMYSAQPSQRLVILNGQVFHEGAQVGAELLVEQIRPKSVVLRFRQLRYEMPL